MPRLLDNTVVKNKLKIERAAQKLFTRQGFHGTTVREIARSAGVSMGKLYLYYPNKEDIFIGLVQHMEQNMEALRQKEILPLMQSPDPESLKKLGMAVGRVVSENLDYWRLMYVDVVEFRHKHFIHSYREVAGGLRTYSAALFQKAPIPFPNAGSPVKPVPGTRPEYTPVAEHYRVDIDLTPPSIDAASWRLRISGLVDSPQQLTIGQLRGDYAKRDQFVTLECISNPIGGPLIGTTLWSGPSFRDVLATAQPRPGANYAHMLAQDGFDEVVALSTVQSDPRVILAYDWNGQPLPTAHGFPLRVYIPDLYGMKQPKWITDIVLVPDFIPGYWVTRGWDKQAIRRTTSVIDTVATSDLQRRAGRTYVPVGGIADAGSRGISKVEIQVDGGPWEPAELRQPLSPLTWVIWRYEWPWQEGEHTFGVRAYDGAGVLQTTTANPTYPSGATGIDTMPASILPQ